MKHYRCSSLVLRLFSSGCEKAVLRRMPHFSEAFSMKGQDQVVEEPWLCQSPLFSPKIDELNTSRINDEEIEVLGGIEESKFLHQSEITDDFCGHSNVDRAGMKNISQNDNCLLIGNPVEEPWISESSTTIEMAIDTCREGSVQNDVTSLEHDKLYQPPPENFLHEEVTYETAAEDSVSTVILINSSLCTMQRIAVLENDKLVELLLEPVKNNVQCDSVYLGVITKLVPHMGGAFVNIGSPRSSFMDIKSNREPFIFPPLHGHLKEREENETMHNKSGVLVNFTEERACSNADEEFDDLEDDESEFIDDEFSGQENHIHFDVLEAMKENVNGSVLGHGNEASHERFQEVIDEDVDQLETKNILQHARSDMLGIQNSKWAQVRKGSKIIVQVVKEGMGTKGPTLTAYPKLKSRFWVFHHLL